MIASDSTSDLDAELYAEYGVKVLPLGVALGECQYTDGVDIIPDDIYANYERTKTLPKTSAINLAAASDFFKKYTDEGYAIVFFTISAQMSSTYQNVHLAATEFEDVHVVDTQNLSTGGGLLVLKAVELAKEGKSASEIADICRAAAPRVDASFVIDSLEFLHKGGRCSALAAIWCQPVKPQALHCGARRQNVGGRQISRTLRRRTDQIHTRAHRLGRGH